MQIRDTSSIFILVAGSWLFAMELLLRHPGYHAKAVLDLCICLYGLATLLQSRYKVSSKARIPLAIAGLGGVLLGGAGIRHTLQAQPFEGYAIVIALAILLHGVNVLASLPWH